MGTGTCQPWFRPIHLKAVASSYQNSIRYLDLGLWFETKHSPDCNRFILLSKKLEGLQQLRCPLKCMIRNTAEISKFRNLSRLSLGSSGCSRNLLKSVVGHLKDLRNLRWLFIQSYFDGNLAASLSACRDLVRLSFGGEGLSDEAAKHISRIDSLEYLDASGSDSKHAVAVCVSDIGLGYLSRLKNLVSLNLDYNHQITFRGIGHIVASLPYLENLCIGAPRVDDETLSTIAQISETIGLRLKCLGLQGSSITSGGLEALSKLPMIRKLDLSYCYHLRVDSIPHLKNLLDRGIRINIDELGFGERGMQVAQEVLGNEAFEDRPCTW
eukprot:CAMPEP_0197525988 /NCGR_PEP_ID=MMETSP1318-20131121/15549_1 /TAXON_ID=552666 /ORGANISM="Partenskyella glossopodia, Strain RCC365" /LENGTH=325 /DNA_ID=CAMNT_0043079885 /DNA_START=241 /DNA_END=1215 /DNA_ORIENTATION=+